MILAKAISFVFVVPDLKAGATEMNQNCCYALSQFALIVLERGVVKKLSELFLRRYPIAWIVLEFVEYSTQGSPDLKAGATKMNQNCCYAVSQFALMVLERGVVIKLSELFLRRYSIALIVLEFGI